MREHWLEIAYRWFGGLILSIFAFAPGWIFVNVVIELIQQPSSFGWESAIALAISGVLLYFLLLLAFRAFTGRGRKEDGGLLPRWAMLPIIHLFGAIAGFTVIFGIVQGKFFPVIGGVVYLLGAYGALAAVRARKKRNA